MYSSGEDVLPHKIDKLDHSTRSIEVTVLFEQVLNLCLRTKRTSLEPS